MPDHNFETVCL